MDTQTTIIAVIILLACLLPFFLVRAKNEKKRKKLVQILLDMAKKNQCQIEKSEFWSQSVMGIDKSKKMLFFSKNANDSKAYSVINLAEIQKCNLIISKNNTKLVDKLELKLEYKNSSKSDIMLEFYNNTQTIPLINELELLKKWHAIVNETL